MLQPGAVKRKFREAVKDEELSQGSCLKKIQWTPWRKAIIPATPKPRGKEARNFKLRSSLPAAVFRGSASSSPPPPPRRHGLRHVHLFEGERKAPAVYEVAVKLRPSKRYVLFFKACASWRRGVVWDTVLLNGEGERREVNAVLAAGGQVWVRRGDGVRDRASLREAEGHVLKHYDYAWQRLHRRRRRLAGRGGGGGGGVGDGETGHRRVKKCNTLISGN